MLNELENKLRKIGLTQNETKVFIGLLKIGESKTGPLIKDSDVGSGRIYEILDSLIMKGLVSFVTKNNVKHYKALPLEKISSYIENKKHQLDLLKLDINSIIPLVNKEVNDKKGTIVEIYEGIEGIKIAFEKELEFPKGTELFCWGIDRIETYDKKIIDYFTYNLFKKRKKFKIKKIFDDSARGEKVFFENSQIKYEPNGSLSDIDLIGDLTIIYIHRGKNLAIAIKDEDIASSLKGAFMEIWNVIK